MNQDFLRADSIVETIAGVAYAAVKAYNSDTISGFLDDVEKMAELAAEHIRTMITGDLATVTDPEGVAREWNEAILFAIQTVEGA